MVIKGYVLPIYTLLKLSETIRMYLGQWCCVAYFLNCAENKEYLILKFSFLLRSF